MARVLMLTTDRQVDRQDPPWKRETLGHAGHLGADRRHAARSADGRTRTSSPRIGSEAETKGAESVALRVYRHARQYLPMNGACHEIGSRRSCGNTPSTQEQFYANLFVPAASELPADVYVAHDLPVLPVAHAFKPALQFPSWFMTVMSSSANRSFRITRSGAGQKLKPNIFRDCDAVITVNPSIANELERRYGIQHCECHLQRRADR